MLQRFKRGEQAILHDKKGQQRVVTVVSWNSKENTYKIKGSSLNYHNDDLEKMIEGKPVKIKVDQILDTKNKLSNKYIEFINENKERVFIAKKDGKHPKGVLYTFEEDDTWLFWEDDLEIVEGVN